jgi:predicted ABC-type ATPase
MFAGPNGSGKSTLKAYLPADLLGSYLNPDEIEQGIRERGFLDFAEHGVVAIGPEVLRFFRDSDFLAKAGLTAAAHTLTFADGRLDFSRLEVNSYLASVSVDFLSQRLLAQKSSFTLETVMSHPGKVALLTQAQAAGYRNYLYFVATDDPAINISRVHNRVMLGGHAVPEDRIVQRYHRSIALLMEAIRQTNRAYIFDNSGDNADRSHTWLAEITDGRMLELKTERIPAWFRRAVLDQTAIKA